MTLLSSSSCSPSTHFSSSHCEKAAGAGFFVVVVFFSKQKAIIIAAYRLRAALQIADGSLSRRVRARDEIASEIWALVGGAKGVGGWVVAFLKNDKRTVTHAQAQSALHMKTIAAPVFYLHLSCRLCNHTDTRSRMCGGNSGAQTGNTHTAVTNHPSGASFSSGLADKAAVPANIG